MTTFTNLSMIEAAAVFIGTLAFPSEHTKAEGVAGALICSAIDLMVANPSTWGEAPENLRLTCKLRDRCAAEKLIKDAARIITAERLEAAKMAFPKLHATVCDAFGVARPSDVPGPMSATMVAAIGVDLSRSDRQRSSRGRKASGGEAEGNKGNIHRLWKPSLPVLHMALALRIELDECNLDGLNFGDMLADPELTARLISRSLTIAPWALETFSITEQITVAPFGTQIN